MTRTLAISLGSLAMGLVVLRGAINGELAAEVAQEAIMTLIVFLGIGAIVGSIADHLVRDSVETLYRNRVQWYRDEIAKREANVKAPANSPKNLKQNSRIDGTAAE